MFKKKLLRTILAIFREHYLNIKQNIPRMWLTCSQRTREWSFGNIPVETLVNYLMRLPLWERCCTSAPSRQQGEIAEGEIQNTKIVILNIHENTSVIHHLKA
jgi:hypothetical protein